MNKHTPAPWHLRADPDDSEGWIVSDGSHSALRVCDVCPRFDPQEEVHNARLIAAAPDMRNALTDLMRQVSKFCEEQGEAEFYTGNAMAALGLSDNEVHLRTLADLRSQSSDTGEPNGS
jgi:hypothetical protein